MDRLVTSKYETIKVMFEYVEEILFKSAAGGSSTVKYLRLPYEILLYQACSLALTDMLEKLLQHLDRFSPSKTRKSISVQDYRSCLLYDDLAVSLEKNHSHVISILLSFANQKLTNAASTGSLLPGGRYCLLHCAAANGDVEVAQLLIHSGFDVNQTNSKKETALYFASDAAMAELLLANGADVNGMKSTVTPLYYACANYRLGVVRKLLENKATPNLGLALLNEACRSRMDSLRIVDILRKLDTGHFTKYISTSCASEVQKGSKTELCATCKSENQWLLTKKSKKIKNQKMSQLHEVICDLYRKKFENGKAHRRKSKLNLSERKPGSINATDESANSALHIVVEKNLIEVATLLLDSGANPNITPTSCKYPLIEACKCLSHDFVVKMLDSGADPNVTDSEGRTPLFFATMSFDLRLVKLLVEHGADVRHLDHERRTALISLIQHCSSLQYSTGCVSAMVRCVEIARYLLDKGCNINQINANGETALCWMIQLLVAPYQRRRFLRGSVFYQLFELFLERRADPKRGRLNGRNSMLAAIQDSSLYAVQEFLRHGANPNQVYKGESLLDSACKRMDILSVRCLLAAGADPNSVGWLHPLTANIDMLNLLLNAGLEINEGIDVTHKDIDSPGFQLIRWAADFAKPEPDLCDFFVTGCSENRGLLRLFAAGCSMKFLAKCCYGKIKQIHNTCCGQLGGRLCQAIVLAGHNVQQEQLIELLLQSGRVQDHDLVSWLDEHAMTPPTLSCLSRTVVRRQLLAASGCRTILPLIDVLPIPNQLRMYLRFEGPYAEVDFKISDDTEFRMPGCVCSR